jgi:hypothetical protein
VEEREERGRMRQALHLSADYNPKKTRKHGVHQAMHGGHSWCFPFTESCIFFMKWGSLSLCIKVIYMTFIYLMSEDNTSINFYKSRVAQRGHVNDPAKDDTRAMIHLGKKYYCAIANRIG